MKRLLSLLIVGLMLFALVACGGGGDDTSGSGTPSGVSSAPAGDEVSDPSTDSTSSDVSGDGTTTSGTPSSSAQQGGTTTKKPNSTTTTTKKPDGSGAEVINRNVTIKKGTTKVENGLNLKGKTITYAIGLALSDSHKRLVNGFSMKYGCTVETTLLGFQDYVQQLASKTAAGYKYDILQVEGLRFPSIAISKFCEPLENVISTADWLGTDISKGGFHEDLTMNFVWNNHLYAVAMANGEFGISPGLIYYNKKLFKQAGAEDPYTLWKKGEWDYDALERIGQQIVKGTNAYLADANFARSIPSMNGARRIDYSDPSKPKAVLTSQTNINGFTFAQKLCVGKNAVIMMEGDFDNTPKALFNGAVAMWIGADYHYADNFCIGENVEKSNAFSKSLDNLGFVPAPKGPDNPGVNTYGAWLYGIGAGVGTSDARIAMAFAKYASSYKTVSTSKYKWTTEQQTMIDNMKTGKILAIKPASFSDGSNIDYKLCEKMEYDILCGGDIAQLTSACNAQVQNCIDVMIAQQ